MPQYAYTPERAKYLDENPDYAVTLEPLNQRVIVEFASEVIADSKGVIVVKESHHDDVYYFPFKDLNEQFLEASDHKTFCPFKGDASYYSIKVGEEDANNAIWTYPSPFTEVEGLKNYVAFYKEKVAISKKLG